MHAHWKFVGVGCITWVLCCTAGVMAQPIAVPPPQSKPPVTVVLPSVPLDPLSAQLRAALLKNLPPELAYLILAVSEPLRIPLPGVWRLAERWPSPASPRPRNHFMPRLCKNFFPPGPWWS